MEGSLHIECCSYSPVRIIFMGNWHAKYCHNCIADILLDRSSVPPYLLRHKVEVSRQDGPHIFRIQVICQWRRANNVCKHDGNDAPFLWRRQLAFSARGIPGQRRRRFQFWQRVRTLALRNQRRTTLDTKFRRGNIDRTAVRTDNETSTAFKTEFGFWWIDSLAIWTAHNYHVLSVSLFLLLSNSHIFYNVLGYWRRKGAFVFSAGLQRAASPLPGLGVSPKNFLFSFCSPPQAANKGSRNCASGLFASTLDDIAEFAYYKQERRESNHAARFSGGSPQLRSDSTWILAGISTRCNSATQR